MQSTCVLFVKENFLWIIVFLYFSLLTLLENLNVCTSVVDTSFSSGVKIGVKWKIMSIREEGVLEPCFELSRGG